MPKRRSRTRRRRPAATSGCWTIFYLDWCGVEASWDWMNEPDFQAAQDFLRKLLGYSGKPDPEKTPYYVVETEAQYARIVAFRQEIERKWQQQMGSQRPRSHR